MERSAGEKTRLVVIDDYGTGGIWGIIAAESAEAITLSAAPRHRDRRPGLGHPRVVLRDRQRVGQAARTLRHRSAHRLVCEVGRPTLRPERTKPLTALRATGDDAGDLPHQASATNAERTQLGDVHLARRRANTVRRLAPAFVSPQAFRAATLAASGYGRDGAARSPVGRWRETSRTFVNPDARRTSSETSGLTRLVAASLQAPRRGLGERGSGRCTVAALLSPPEVVGGSGVGCEPQGSPVGDEPERRFSTRARGRSQRGNVALLRLGSGCESILLSHQQRESHEDRRSVSQWHH